MHKSALPYIDPCMGILFTSGIEKYEVTRSWWLVLNTLTFGAHFLNGTRQLDIRRFTIDIDNQSTAIKSPFGIIAPIAIGHSY
jgi:hypothetical protein